MPFFDERHMPQANNEYVCWLDLMGTKNKMYNSVRTSGVFIFKLHSAVLESLATGIEAVTYPVMDGVYVTTKTKQNMELFLKKVFALLANDYVQQANDHYKYLVKASLAFGAIVHGSDIPNEANRIFSDHPQYKASILLGLPMIQAFSSEREAPPFGIFVHESARGFAAENEKPFDFKWWKWFINNGDFRYSTQDFKDKLESYFNYCLSHSLELDYPKEKIDLHKQAVNQYFI